MRASKGRGTRAGEELAEGRYQLHEPLESSELFESHRATDRHSRREVRIRFLRAELALQRAAAERFLAVPKTLARLSHPNLPEVVAIESDELGIPFVVEEQVVGESLGALFRRFRDGMPLGVAVHTLTPVSEAVAAAHDAGLVHGHLGREEVVLVTRAGAATPKVLGFGGAAKPGVRVDPREDVRALGALLYEALCGEAPQGRFEALHERAPHLPDELTELVGQCLANNATARPANATAVRDVLMGIRDKHRPGRNAEAAAVVAMATAPTLAEPTAAPVAVASSARRSQPAAGSGSAAVSGAGSVVGSGTGTRTSTPTGSVSGCGSVSDSVSGSVSASRSAPPLTDAPDPFPMAGSVRPAAPAPGALITFGGAARAFALTDDEKRAAEAALEQDAREFAEVSAAAATPAAPERASRPNLPAAAATKELRRAGAPNPVTARASQPEQKPVRPARVPSLTDVERSRMTQAHEDQRRRRVGRLGALLLLLFALFLPFAIPLLSDHARAQLAFGTGTKFAVAGFTVLSIFAVVHTWALQLAQPMVLLRPVTTTQRVVTACVSVLAAGFFLPNGALGPAEMLGGFLLPWASGGFFFFLALYGLRDSIARAADQAWAALVLALLYSGGLYGSYRSISYGIEAQQRSAHGRSLAQGSPRSLLGRLRELASGKSPSLAIDAGVAAGSDFQQQSEVGASEEQDMRGVEQLRTARKQKGQQLEGLGKQLGDVGH